MKRVVIRPRSGWIPIDWSELWEYRELLAFLVMRDLVVRYKQTVLGVAWAVLQPLVSMLIFTVIFGRLAGIPSDGVPYPVFVYAGLLPWMFFSNAVTTASQSLISQQALLTKIYLPRIFIPSSAIGSGLVDFGVAFLVFVGLMIFYDIAVTPRLLLLPFFVAWTTLLALGVGSLLAAVTVTYRDFRYVVPFMLQAWMYLSPVVYPVSLVPTQWQWLLGLNPLVGIIDAFRWCLLDRTANVLTVAPSLVVTAGLFVMGMLYFRRSERRFADVV